MPQHQPPSNMTRTSLLVPDQIKAAVIAITKCRVMFFESLKDPCGGPHLKDGGIFNSVSSFRAPDVMIWLFRAGLPTVLRHIEHALETANGDLQAAEAVLDFFLANPTARDARLENFEPGSDAAKLFADMADDVVQSDQVEAISMDRRTAMGLQAERQKTAMLLSEAKGALQIAIGTVKPHRSS